MEPGSAEIPSHLKCQASPSLCTSSNLHPLCTYAHGRTRVRTNRQLADSSCPCTTRSGAQANPLPALFWMCACSLLGTRSSSCPLLFVMALVLESLGSESEENAPFPHPRFPQLARSSALHRIRCIARPPPCPAWLEGSPASRVASKPSFSSITDFALEIQSMISHPKMNTPPWSPSSCSLSFRAGILHTPWTPEAHHWPPQFPRLILASSPPLSSAAVDTAEHPFLLCLLLMSLTPELWRIPNTVPSCSLIFTSP